MIDTKTSSLKIRIAVLSVIGILVGGITIGYVIQNQQKTKAAGDSVELAIARISPGVISMNAIPSTAINVRGYAFDIQFDTAKASVANIDYKFGAISNNLGDSNSTLNAVNNAGLIHIQAEVQSATPVPMGTSAVELVHITFQKKGGEVYTFSVKPNTGVFYVTVQDNTLGEVLTNGDPTYTGN